MDNKRIKIVYMSFSGNVRSFTHRLQEYATQQHHLNNENPLVDLLEISEETLPTESDSKFLKRGKETRSFKDVMNCPLFYARRAYMGNVNYGIIVGMKDTNRLTYGRTSVYNLNYHIIWGTKYRNKVLTGRVEIAFKRIIHEIAAKYGFEIAHMEIGKDDHVHLLVSAPPKLSVTNIVRWLKGGTAYQLFRECPELQRSYWKKEGRHLWSPSYYVESIGAVNEQAVAKYIDDQQKKEVELE